MELSPQPTGLPDGRAASFVQLYDKARGRFDGNGEAHLYLGAEAEARQIMGLAGSYALPPASDACTDAEWRA